MNKKEVPLTIAELSDILHPKKKTIAQIMGTFVGYVIVTSAVIIMSLTVASVIKLLVGFLW